MDRHGLVRRLRISSIVPLVCLCSSVIYAEESAESNIVSSPFYGYLFVGDNTSSSHSGNLKPVNYKSGGPYEWGIGLGRYLTDIVSVEGTFEYWGERYERQGAAIIPGTENNVIQAGGLGLSMTAVVNYTQRDIHAYAGLGAGYFLTGILITEPGSGLLTDDGAPSDKILPGYHVSLGVDYRVSNNHKLGVEYKRRFLKADFGQYTNGKVDIGGSYLLFVYRHSSK